MDEKRKRIRDILNNGEWTPEDARWMDAYLRQADQQVLAEIAEEFFEADLTPTQGRLGQGDSAQLLQGIHQRIYKKPKRMWWPYAAAVVLLIISFGWWFTERGAMPVLQEASVEKPDMLPGGNKATLVLADGRTVVLSESQEGVVIGEEIRYADGSGILDGEAVDLISTENSTISTPKGGVYRLTLPDGTSVWLNALTQLRFPTQFGESSRVVYLDGGEAYFEVAHEARRPFIVESADHEIEVLGTSFNVESYTNTTFATLVEGSVRVKKSRESRVLRAGQSMAINERLSFVDIDIEKALAWKQGVFVFKSDRIDDIMAQLARWYDLEVIYKGEVPREKEFSGDISRYVKLSEVSELLSFVTGASFEIKGRQLIVTFSE